MNKHQYRNKQHGSLWARKEDHQEASWWALESVDDQVPLTHYWPKATFAETFVPVLQEGMWYQIQDPTGGVVLVDSVHSRLAYGSIYRLDGVVEATAWETKSGIHCFGSHRDDIVDFAQADTKQPTACSHQWITTVTGFARDFVDCKLCGIKKEHI